MDTERLRLLVRNTYELFLPYYLNRDIALPRLFAVGVPGWGCGETVAG